MSKSLIQHATVTAIVGSLAVIALGAGATNADDGATDQAATADARLGIDAQALGGFPWIC